MIHVSLLQKTHTPYMEGRQSLILLSSTRLRAGLETETPSEEAVGFT